MTNKTILFGILVLLLLAGCNNRQPNTSEAVKQLIGDDLKEWLMKAPFDGIWDPYEGQKRNATVFTNIEQVFPYAEKFYNKDGIISFFPKDSTNRYKSITVFF